MTNPKPHDLELLIPSPLCSKLEVYICTSALWGVYFDAAAIELKSESSRLTKIVF